MLITLVECRGQIALAYLQGLASLTTSIRWAHPSPNPTNTNPLPLGKGCSRVIAYRLNLRELPRKPTISMMINSPRGTTLLGSLFGPF